MKARRIYSNCPVLACQAYSIHSHFLSRKHHTFNGYYFPWDLLREELLRFVGVDKDL